MFYLEAREYIEKLIHIQEKMKTLGFCRSDQKTVNDCLYRLKKLLGYWSYSTNEKMSAFWIHHKAEIRAILPTQNYKGFETLLANFEELDRKSKLLINQ